MYVGWLLQIPEWANEATHALTTALSILSEGETPFEWADAKVQQAGIEYHRAEEHLAFEPSKQSLEHLERAVTLCEDALRVYDPVREPLAWVTSNRILAKALTLKGAQVNDPSFLMRAVQILKDLADLDDLDQHRSEYILVHEARAAVALAAAGFLPSTDVLRDGIQSIGLALQRVSPTTHSFQWGNMKVIQGSIYFAVGGTVANIQQAVDSFAEAAEVYKASSEHRYRTRALQKYNEAQERLREYIRLTERYGTGA
jgi:tetratricopeptide (TPR) repeat protein